jgi:hypothetical protein
MTEIRQCWAFHRDGARCEHPAGHPGDHAVQKTWTDLECATPGEFEPAPPVVAPVIPPLVQKVVSCVACQHKHKDGPCKCGCYEFVG